MSPPKHDDDSEARRFSDTMLKELAEDARQTRRLADTILVKLETHLIECASTKKMVDTHDIILNGPPGDTDGKGGLVGRARFYERTGGIAWAAFTTAVGTAFLLGVDWFKKKVIGQ